MNKKLTMDTITIEVTRRCNMNCAHCLRGEPQNKDITHDIIDKALRNITDVNCIAFTGGEVTLNVDAIRYTLDVCKKKDIKVFGFYIVTNGKFVPDEFLLACIEWYSYVMECGGDAEITGLALSQDNFHEPISLENVSKLKALSFYCEDKKKDFTKTGLIDLGRAKMLSGYKKREMHYPERIDISIDNFDRSQYQIFDSNILVTVDGDILIDCDYEYESAENIKIGDVNDELWFVHCYSDLAAKQAG